MEPISVRFKSLPLGEKVSRDVSAIAKKIICKGESFLVGLLQKVHWFPTMGQMISKHDKAMKS